MPKRTIEEVMDELRNRRPSITGGQTGRIRRKTV